MGRYRLSFSERRRARLAKQVDRIDILETLNTIIEPISLTAMSLGIAPALTALGLSRADGNGATALVPRVADGQGTVQASRSNAAPRAPIAPDDVVPLDIVPKPAGGGGAPAGDAAATSTPHEAARDDGDWLTLSPAVGPTRGEPGRPSRRS